MTATEPTANMTATEPTTTVEPTSNATVSEPTTSEPTTNMTTTEPPAAGPAGNETGAAATNQTNATSGNPILDALSKLFGGMTGNK
jgi:hypothetical protein